MTGHVTHARTVIAFCIVAIAGYGAFSLWAVFYSADPTLTGDVVGTWKSFAVAAFAFWLGSSSGGKAKDERPPEAAYPPPNPIDVPEPSFGRAEQ